MGYETYIVLALILMIVGLAAGYVIRAKKKGTRCIGCPYAECPSKKQGSCSETACMGNCSCCSTLSSEDDGEKKE